MEQLPAWLAAAVAAAGIATVYADEYPSPPVDAPAAGAVTVGSVTLGSDPGV